MALHLLKKPNNKWPGIQEGDEVLATALTCTASNFPILANGLKIKWVDIDPTTLNMDLDDLARKITPKTKAIILVHWGGYPSDLNKVKQIQNQTKAKLILLDNSKFYSLNFKKLFELNFKNNLL
jgi:dTDP-4-amino-4,6-dideoxygalactose transaminase